MEAGVNLAASFFLRRPVACLETHSKLIKGPRRGGAGTLRGSKGARLLGGQTHRRACSSSTCSAAHRDGV
eukprot:scaffold51220_cov80-Phaeocystis_antarctica.AAC.1